MYYLKKISSSCILHNFIINM